jgi:hypothetical protein
MATYVDRSMEAELLAGSVDGTYKRVVMDRSTYPDPDRRMQVLNRLMLNRGANGYGVYEAREKRTPDGRFAS